MFDLATAPLPHDQATDRNSGLPTPRSRTFASQQRRLQRSLAEAVAGGDLLLRYQPRLALDTGRQTAAEAVIRWRDRQGGPNAPSAFARMAEDSGVSGEIGGWMLRAACAEAASWPSGCVVSVAVSARQLAGGMLLGQIAAALEESGLNPELLEVALTEASLIDLSVNTLLLLSAIRDLGAGVALDRFGAGLASLAVLHRLPLTAMKLDGSLLGSLAGDGQGAALVRTIIAAGHALDLAVVADGIGTAEQCARLRAGGCDEGQGALFGQSLSGVDMRARHADQRPTDTCMAVVQQP